METIKEDLAYLKEQSGKYDDCRSFEHDGEAWKRVEARVAEIERTITGMDCRVVGRVAEFSGSHCPIDKPCDRCGYERRIEELEAKLALAADALDTCQPGDYTTGHVCHPYFDEAKVDAAIKALKAEGDDPKF